jgi:hypothetical protein
MCHFIEQSSITEKVISKAHGFSLQPSGAMFDH